MNTMAEWCLTAGEQLQKKEKRPECPVWRGCPVWRRRAIAWKGEHRKEDFARQCWSPRAGGFFLVPDSGAPGDDALKIDDDTTRRLLSSWIWEQNNLSRDPAPRKADEQRPLIDNDMLGKVCNRPQLADADRCDRALRVLHVPASFLSADQRRHLLLAATECGTDEEGHQLIKRLLNDGLVRRESDDRFILTREGRDRMGTADE